MCAEYKVAVFYTKYDDENTVDFIHLVPKLVHDASSRKYVRGDIPGTTLSLFSHRSTYDVLTSSSKTNAKYARTHSESLYSKWGNTFLLTMAVLNMSLEERI